MVVDGLFNSLSVLKGSKLLEHKVEVVLNGVKSGKSGNLTSTTVVGVVVIKADNSGKVRNEGVGFPSIISSESSSKRSNYIEINLLKLL